MHTVCDLWLKTHTALFLPHQKQQHKELKKASKYTKLCTRTMKFSPCSTVQTWVEMPWQNELQFLFALWHVETPCRKNWPHSLFALWQVETPQQNKPQSLFRNHKPSLHYDKWWRHSKTNHNPSLGTTNPLCIMTSGDATAKQTTIPLFIVINIKQTPSQCKVSAKSKTWNLLLGFCCHAAALSLLRLWRLWNWAKECESSKNVR